MQTARHVIGAATLAALLTTSACATERVASHSIELEQPNSGDASAGLASFLLTVDLSAAADADIGRELRLRIDGLEAVFGGDFVRVSVGAVGGLSASIEEGTHVVELIDDQDQTVFSSGPVAFVAGRANVVAVHGPLGALGGLSDSSDWTGLAAGMTLATFMNAGPGEGTLELCTTNTSCSILATGLAEGDTWSGVASYGSWLRFVPPGPGASTETNPLGFMFSPASPQDASFDTQNGLRLHASIRVGPSAGELVEFGEARPE